MLRKKSRFVLILLAFGLGATGAFLACGCTLSVNMVHTEGTASDVVDEDQAAEPTVSPNVNITPKAI